LDDKRFWDVIAVACQPGASEQAWHEGLFRELRGLTPEDLVAFDRWFDQKTRAAYRSDLIAACSTLSWGGSDDGFYHFRCWLVGMGKRVYEAALADADTLADVERRPVQGARSSIYVIALRVWREEFGRTESEFDELQMKLNLPPITPKEESWDTNDETVFRRRLPRLAALYFGDPDE
jgi:Protein of unknown function (DUF4240)